MPKSDLTISNAEYAPVADRIRLFYETFPEGRIITRLISRRDREILFRAAVFRSQADKQPASTGWASERVGDGDINVVACLENTETSAIGRALANLGFTASRQRPSAEEMEKTERARARMGHARRGIPPNAPAALVVPPVSAARELEERPGKSPRAVREPAPLSPGVVDDALQARADALSDFLDLVRAGERAGLRPQRAKLLRARALHGMDSPEVMRRLARRLRRWVIDHSTQRLIGRADDFPAPDPAA